MNIDFSSKLNPQQLDAVNEIERSVLVMAGAGSGKTSVLTYRIANLIQSGTANPSEILVFTFTNKAASVVKERLYALQITGMHMAWMGTFHSICVRILRQHAEKLGYRANFVIYDTSDQKALLKRLIKEGKLEVDPGDMREKISRAKNGGDEFIGTPLESEVYRRYQEQLLVNNAMDFDDLINNTIKILETFEEVRAYYNQKFRYIHVDEYQDTNPAQFKLVKLLAGDGNVFAVGDIDQSIYKWRGADIANIQNFEKDFAGSRVVVLEQNYRSTQNILSLANSVIVNNQGRGKKELWSDHGRGSLVNFYSAENEKEEARFVVDQLQNRADYYGYNGIAILYRTNSQSRVFELLLRDRGIPYNVVGGHKFFDRKEVKDVLAYLKLLLNPTDDVSFERVINEPKRGIGETTIEKLSYFARSNRLSLLEASRRADEIDSLRGPVKKKLQEFASGIYQLYHDQPSMKIDQVFQAVLDFSGIIEAYELEGTTEADSRVENIYEFQNYVNENAGDMSLTNFVEDVSLRSDQDEYIDSGEKVTLMTIHTAKGLEFDCVFIVGMNEEILPSGRSIGDKEAVEEERRLCYVAITRAKKELYISNMRSRNLYGKPTRMASSRFLKEMDQSLIQNLSQHPIVFDSGSHGNDGDAFGYYEDYSDYRNSKYAKSNKGYESSRRQGYWQESGSGFDVHKKSASFKPHLPKDEKHARTMQCSVGDKVVHDVFGEGVVLDVDGRFVRIVFDEVGIKKLDPSIAPMQKRYTE